MRAKEFITEADMPRRFYHGSMVKLPVGAILTPQDNYEENWQHTDFYAILETYRPSDMLGHKQAVFMCGNADDVDLAGGGTEWLFIVKPLGSIERHDVNWGSEISMLISDGHSSDSPDIIQAAKNYWDGTPHVNEQVWEYLTPSAKVLRVEEYQ